MMSANHLVRRMDAIATGMISVSLITVTRLTLFCRLHAMIASLLSERLFINFHHEVPLLAEMLRLDAEILARYSQHCFQSHDIYIPVPFCSSKVNENRS